MVKKVQNREMREHFDGAHCSRGYKYKKQTAIWRHFWRLNENVIKTRKTEKSCAINLSGKGVDVVADCSIVRFSTLWRQVFSSFLRQAGANRLYKVELNILVSLIFTKPETRFKHCLSLKNYFYCKNEIFFMYVPRTFLLESGRGGKALGTRLNPDHV